MFFGVPSPVNSPTDKLSSLPSSFALGFSLPTVSQEEYLAGSVLTLFAPQSSCCKCSSPSSTSRSKWRKVRSAKSSSRRIFAETSHREKHSARKLSSCSAHTVGSGRNFKKRSGHSVNAQVGVRLDSLTKNSPRQLLAPFRSHGKHSARPQYR